MIDAEVEVDVPATEQGIRRVGHDVAYEPDGPKRDEAAAKGDERVQRRVERGLGRSVRVRGREGEERGEPEAEEKGQDRDRQRGQGEQELDEQICERAFQSSGPSREKVERAALSASPTVPLRVKSPPTLRALSAKSTPVTPA